MSVLAGVLLVTMTGVSTVLILVGLKYLELTQKMVVAKVLKEREKRNIK